MKLIKLPGIAAPVDVSSPIYTGSHFTWDEVTKGGMRLPVSTLFEGRTVLPDRIVLNIISLARMLDEIREEFGDRPITVNSWYRPPDVNAAVGGVLDSQHLLGWAVDITILGYTPYQVYAILSKYWPGGLGKNRRYTHLDMRHLLGWSAARWLYGSA
jgi:Peptidase M15